MRSWSCCRWRLVTRATSPPRCRPRDLAEPHELIRLVQQCAMLGTAETSSSATLGMIGSSSQSKVRMWSWALAWAAAAHRELRGAGGGGGGGGGGAGGVYGGGETMYCVCNVGYAAEEGEGEVYSESRYKYNFEEGVCEPCPKEPAAETETTARALGECEDFFGCDESLAAKRAIQAQACADGVPVPFSDSWWACPKDAHEQAWLFAATSFRT